MNGSDIHTDAIRPPRNSALGFKSWLKEMALAAEWSVNPPPYPEEPLPHGAGEPVLLIPGFMAGDWTLGRLKGFLERIDYVPVSSGVQFNPGPMRLVIEQFERRLEAVTEELGPVRLLGVSLGGVFARHLARAHAARVRHVITLCAPVRFPVTTALAPFVRALAPLHSSEFRGAREAIATPLPMPSTALYTEDDGILDWRQCLPDPGENQDAVRVSGAHIALGSNPEAQRAIAVALAKYR